MRRHLIVLTAIVAAGAAAFSFTQAADDSQAKGGIQWVDYQSGMKAAKDSGKPVMIDFMASWCRFCAMLDKQVYTKPEIIDLSKKFVCIKVDTDRNAKLPQQYSVRGLPTVVFTDSHGKELQRIVGFRKADSFKKAMQSALKKAK